MDSIIIFCAKYLFVAIVLLYALALYQASRKHKKALLISFVIAGITAVILYKIAGKLYYNPRPFVSQHIKPLIPHSADNGFPSEHTIFTMTISSVLYYYRRRLGWLAFALSLIVGLGRIAAHIHSPIDIIGGTIIGIASGSLAYWLTNRLLESKRSGGRSADSK